MPSNDGLPSASCLETIPGPRDYAYGRETAFDSGDYDADWEAFLPSFEVQYQRKRKNSLDKVFDTSACVTFSVANVAEMIFRHRYESGRISADQLALLEGHGFIERVDGEPFLNISDRDLAARAGTTKDGNSFARVCETLRTVGPIPESAHPFSPDIKTWEAYMVPGPELPEARAAFLSVFEVQWEWLFWGGDNLTHAQKLDRLAAVVGTAPVLTSSPICPGWSRFTAKAGKVIEWCGKREGGHATAHLSNRQTRLDHYEPFVKTLAPDYWVNHAVRMTLTVKAPKPSKPKPTAPSPSLQYGSKLHDVTALQDCLEFLGFQTVKSDPKRPHFGDRTAEALLAFQLAEKVDAATELKRLAGRYYGPKSYRALVAALARA